MADGGNAGHIDLRLHKRQTVAFRSPATEILYGGAAGGGKSHLMRVAAIAWCYDIPGLQVYIFRREFPDLYKNHMEGPTGFPSMLAQWVNIGAAKVNLSKNQIEFKNGSKIHLCHCKHETDVLGYQGAEIHVLMVDELTHFSASMYRYLRSRVRLGGLKVPAHYVDRFPRIVAGSNPGGVGHNWVRGAWIEPAKAGAAWRTEPKEGGLLRQFIPARLDDNPTLLTNDPDYLDRLSGLGNDALVRAMRDGDWNIVSGGALDDVWTERVTVARFAVPSSWRVDRGFDWGSTHPFSVLWFAEADGTEATLPGGGKWCPRRGSIIVVHEWYGAKGPNEGLKMGARDIGRGIKSAEASLISAGWCSRVLPGPADNQISAVTQPGTPTIADEMRAEGITWTESEKSPGSRKIGLDLTRSRIREAGKDHPENPALYIMDHCRSLLSHLPVLPRDPRNTDDVDSSAEDHDYDVLRYRVLAARRSATVQPLRI